MLRRDTLCSNVRYCAEAREVQCSVCQAIRVPVDIRAPSETPCPGCEHSWRYKRLPCVDCPAESLDRQVMVSGLKELIDQIVAFDMVLRKGVTLTMDDLTMEEFLGLTVLWQEQDRQRAEDMEDQQRKMREHAAPISTHYQTRPV